MAVTVAYLIISLTSIGLLTEGNTWGSYFELSRCLIFLALSTQHRLLFGVLQIYFLVSALIWLIVLLLHKSNGFVWIKQDHDDDIVKPPIRVRKMSKLEAAMERAAHKERFSAIRRRERGRRNSSVSEG